MSYDFDESLLLAALRPLIAPCGDLLLGILLTVVAVVGMVTTGGAIRAALGLPLVLLLPGYAVVSVLFPGRPGRDARLAPGLGTRLALAVGISVSVSVLVGFVLGAVGLPLSTLSVAGSLTVVSLLGLTGAVWRRLQLPAERRFGLPFREWAASAWRGVARQDSALDGVLNVALVLAVLVGVSTLGYALVVPAHSASFSSFAVLSANGSDDPVAGNYSTNLTQGAPQEFLLSVENHEGERTEYAVVSELQRVNTTTDTVTERTELDRRTGVAQAGETWEEAVSVTPSLSGDRLRIAFYLYTGDAPAQVDSRSADEHLYLWVTVTPG